ncbi:MAG TPA: hypothetical protein VJR89_14045, partial [Polyangiales bacterium]|nr:hypothetical protein [Polyangiales bacterium]
MSRFAAALVGASVLVLALGAHAQDVASAKRALGRGDYARAERELRALPESTAAQTLLARLLIETGRYGEAAEVAALAMRDPQQRVAAGTLRGDALLAQGALDAAEGAYRELLEDRLAFRARAKLGALLMDRGNKAEATPLLEGVLAAYRQREATRPPGLLGAALAARRLADFQLANQIYREAAVLDRTRVDTQLEWAQLFLDKYDQKHAAESVIEALANNPHAALAHTYMARLQLMQSMDFDEADAALERALRVNPNLVAAHVTRAGMALRNMELGAADAALDRALGVNPNDLEALSVRAAVRFLAADAQGLAQAKRAVLARNPHFSRMFSIIAEYAEWEHRYPELVDLAREALAIDPEDAEARATLGLNLLRMGDERAGLASLRTAWERDRFNVQVFNTLKLYDRAIAEDYVSYTSKPFEIRLYKADRPVLEPYLGALLARAWADLRKRYAFTPEGPLHIELYADPVQFSVRTTGFPTLGVQGVCFGKVVTGLSPRAGPYNWGQIVWHELTHVFHLQLSKGRVPRWFTEGLAEYETTLARPEWKREDDPLLYDALRSERLPDLATMNRAFTRARTPRDMLTAYYAAYSAVKYLVERFGIDRVRGMLPLWGAGKPTPEVFERALGGSLEQLDRDFRAHVVQRLARFVAEFQVDFAPYRDLAATRALAQKAPGDADAQAGLALAEVLAEHFDAAESAAGAALRISPQHRVANFALARVALAREDAAAAERHLRAILASGADGYLLRMLLAHAALAGSQLSAAVSELEAAIALDPDRLEAWQTLLEVAGKLKDEAMALRAVTALAQLDQHDRAVHAAYVAMLTKREAWPEVVRAG